MSMQCRLIFQNSLAPPLPITIITLSLTTAIPTVATRPAMMLEGIQGIAATGVTAAMVVMAAAMVVAAGMAVVAVEAGAAVAVVAAVKNTAITGSPKCRSGSHVSIPSCCVAHSILP